MGGKVGSWLPAEELLVEMTSSDEVLRFVGLFFIIVSVVLREFIIVHRHDPCKQSECPKRAGMTSRIVEDMIMHSSWVLVSQ